MWWLFSKHKWQMSSLIVTAFNKLRCKWKYWTKSHDILWMLFTSYTQNAYSTFRLTALFTLSWPTRLDFFFLKCHKRLLALGSLLGHTVNRNHAIAKTIKDLISQKTKVIISIFFFFSILFNFNHTFNEYSIALILNTWRHLAMEIQTKSNDVLLETTSRMFIMLMFHK